MEEKKSVTVFYLSKTIEADRKLYFQLKYEIFLGPKIGEICTMVKYIWAMLCSHEHPPTV